MLELHISNVLTKIIGDIPAHVKSMIREQCAYSIKGAEFSTYGAATYCPICKKNTEQLTWEEKRSCPQDGFMYRKCHMHGLVKPVSLWDGRKFLFDARSENFPTGVISRVTSVLKTFGVPYKIIDERIVPYTRRLTWHGPQLRYYQKDAVNSLITKSRGILQGATAMGKCVWENTPTLMYDGSIVLAKDVKVGDLVMGYDSKPRTVAEVHKGTALLYKVQHKRGSHYLVTGNHILTGKITKMSNTRNRYVKDINGNKYFAGDIVDISVKDFLKSSSTFKHVFKGFSCGVTNFGGNNEPLLLDPYVLGLWLADGSANQMAITTMDYEVSSFWKTLVIPGLKLTVYTKKHQDGRLSKASTYVISKERNSGIKQNPYLVALDHYNLRKNKHIPNVYKVASFEDRAKLLAGLLDADGYSDGCGIEICQKNGALANDIAFVARSLGLSVYITDKISSCQGGFVGTYKRLRITGDFSHIPFCVERIKVAAKTKYNKEQRLFGVEVTPDRIDNYVGFSVKEEDKHYLLGDFTVVHNSTVLAALTAEVGVNTLILAHTAAVFNQLYETIKKDLKMPIGRIGDGYDEPGKITVAMPQSLVGSIKVPKRKLVKGVWKTVNSSVAVIKDKYKDFLVNTEALYIDECFQYNTLVKTERGYEKIGRLVEQGKKVRVYCFNKDLNKFVLMPIVKFYKKESPRELVQLKFNDTFLYLTPNHEVYILDKATNSITKKRADQLTVSDCVIIQQGDSSTYGTRAVKSIRLVKSFEKFVYNIEVEEHHNYLVTRENILVSNCHRVACDTVQLVANSCVNAYFRIGVSATPYRADLLDILIEAATGKVNFKYTATQAISDGYLSKPNIHLVRFPQKPYPRKKLSLVKDSRTGQMVEKEVPVKYADLYKDRVTNNKQRNLLIANIAYKHYKKNESVLVIVRHLEHGENLYNELKYLGPTVKWVNGENNTEELKQVLKELNDGTCKICIASGIFNEGIDVTGLNVCINTTACDSPVTAMQILGRTLRRTSTKSEVDFYDIFDYGVRWLGEHANSRLDMYKTEPGFDIFNEEYTQYI